MHTRKKVLLSVLLASAGVLGVFVWAEARSAAMFSEADLREAKRAMPAANEGRNEVPSREKTEAMRLFEKTVTESQSTSLTATYCGVGIVLVSMACVLAIWLPSEGETPDTSPEATPGKRPPAAPGSSSGAPQL